MFFHGLPARNNLVAPENVNRIQQVTKRLTKIKHMAATENFATRFRFAVLLYCSASTLLPMPCLFRQWLTHTILIISRLSPINILLISGNRQK